MATRTWHHLLALFLSLLSALASSLAQTHVVYNCSSSPSPGLISRSPMRFGLRMSISGSAGDPRFCHVRIRGDWIKSSMVYFYVRLNGSLVSPLSALTLSSEFGASGVPVAMVTALNQAEGRAFASPSGSLYARLSGAAVDSLVLDVELVTGCPSSWSRHGGACYGAPSADTVPAAFRDAALGCRAVRANLAMESQPGGILARAAGSAGAGLEANQSVWVGAAVSGSRAYLLDGRMLVFGDLIRFRDPDVNSGFLSDSSTPTPTSADRSCVYFRSGGFYRSECDRRLRYLCSRPVPGGQPLTFHTLEGLTRWLSKGKQNATISPHLAYFSRVLLIVLLGFVAAAVVVATFVCWLRLKRRTAAAMRRWRWMLRQRRRRRADCVSIVGTPPLSEGPSSPELKPPRCAEGPPPPPPYYLDAVVVGP